MMHGLWTMRDVVEDDPVVVAKLRSLKHASSARGSDSCSCGRWRRLLPRAARGAEQAVVVAEERRRRAGARAQHSAAKMQSANSCSPSSAA